MRTILISGANRGIGKSIAIEALKNGHRLSLGIRNIESIKGTLLDPKRSGDSHLIINKYEALEEITAIDWVKNTEKNFGKIDTLIHCAGILKKTELLFKDSQKDELEKMWRVNVLGPWLLTKATWKHLEKSGIGRIIVMVSMSGKRSKGKLAGYVMSKFALMGLCETMRNEGWEKGIRVTAICPGWVNTDMSKGINVIKKDEMTQPEDIGKLCCQLLNMPNSSIPFEIKINCNLEV